VSGDTAALVGADARVVYRATVPAGAKLVPDALGSATTGYAVVGAAASPDGSWTWTVVPLDAGDAPFVARWTLDGAPVESPPVRLAAAAPPLPPDADIADIKGPLAAGRAWWPWLLAALLGAAAWEAWRRLRRRPGEGPAPEPAAPPVPPEVAAARALAELAASGLWERGEHAAYYLRLTDVLREYLEARYAAPATAMTSVEVARLLKDKRPDLRLAASTRELLQRADLVKFARWSPDDGDGARDAGLVSEIVTATTPADAAAPAAPEAPR
jgi:hypothetical protein